MPSPNNYTRCPLKPPSRISVIGSAIPEDACDLTKCAFYLSSIDNRTGKIVGGACAIPFTASALAQLTQIVSTLVRQPSAGQAAMQTPTPTPPKVA